MKSKGVSPLLIIGGGLAAYFLFFSGSTPPAAAPGTAPVAVAPANLLSTLLPGIPAAAAVVAPAVPTTYGVNAGYSGNVTVVTNYPALLAANPNLANPNYQMSATENAQYLANYLDLRTALPAWVGHKAANGKTPANLAQAAQIHWTLYGCAEQRIFLPLQPPSAVNFIPPPVNPKASSGTWIGSAISAAGSVAAAAIMIAGVNQEPLLNDAEVELIITGGAIASDLLPMFAAQDPISVQLAQTKLKDTLIQYT